MPTETPDASARLSDVACIYHAIDACVSAFYDIYHVEDKVRREKAYGLVMAIERLNDEIGRHTGVIA